MEHSSMGTLPGDRHYTDNRLRPLARRRRITRIPPLVRILALKPCVRARLILLG